jgi:hypothetical protein
LNSLFLLSQIDYMSNFRWSSLFDLMRGAEGLD